MYVWNKWGERLGRVEKETPKMFFVMQMRVAEDGTLQTAYSSRWPKDRCLRMTEKVVELVRELASLDRHYRTMYENLRAEHLSYRKPIVQAIEEAAVQPQEKL